MFKKTIQTKGKTEEAAFEETLNTFVIRVSV